MDSNLCVQRLIQTEEERSSVLLAPQRRKLARADDPVYYLVMSARVSVAAKQGRPHRPCVSGCLASPGQCLPPPSKCIRCPNIPDCYQRARDTCPDA